MQGKIVVRIATYLAIANLICGNVSYAEDKTPTANGVNIGAPADESSTQTPSPDVTTLNPTSNTDIVTAQTVILEADNPLTLAAQWLQDAKTAGVLPKYAIISTLQDMRPSIETIAIGELTPQGYVFRLNEDSTPNRALSQTDSGTILIGWGDKSGGNGYKQIKINGTIAPQGAAEEITITYKGKPLTYKSRTYLLKPTSIQLAVKYSASAHAGVTEYMNYNFAEGRWTKEEKQILGFYVNQ